ncbi:MAG TPA: hypothetical protein VFL72_06940 [Acidimicrobiia bacterium]|nr:hypothetical protein [Acidimicrobiia bacterium]
MTVRQDDTTPSTGSRFWPWFGRVKTRVFRAAFYKIDNERLDGALEQLLVRIEARKGPDLTESSGKWLERAEQYYTKARQHQDARQLNAAWSAFSAADRALVGCFQPQELLLEAKRVAAEADKKLDGWRRKASASIWPADRTAKWWETRLEPSEVEELRLEVMMIRQMLDDSSDTTYWKHEYQRSQMRRSAQAVVIMLVALVIVMAVVLEQGWDAASDKSLVADLRSLVVVITLGGLGASLSGLLTVSQRNLSEEIPKIRAQWNLIRFRPIIGAVSAIAVVGILQSGIGGLNVEPEAAVIAAFLAGFSERFVSGAVARAGSTLSGESPPTTP